MRNFRTWLKKLVVIAGMVAITAALAPAQTPKKAAAGSEPQKQTQASQPRTTAAAQRRPAARSGNWRTRQQVIDRARTREIQEALIREGYLAGPADGVWGETSKTAMEKYQADNGWQTKLVPDSRALIKLGLGPTYANVLNPESLAADNSGATPGGGTENGESEQQQQQ